MTDTMDITEARAQLAEAEDALHRIRARIASIEAGGSAVEAQRRERELAQQLLDGGDVSTVVVPAMSTGQIRVAVSALRSAEVEALERVNQARGALRRVKVTRLKEVLEERKVEFDRKAAELLAAYSDVHAASERICAATGVDPRSPNWWTLQIPRAVPAKVGAFFDGGVLCVRGQDVVASSIGAAANTRLVELMRQEGLEV